MSDYDVSEWALEAGRLAGENIVLKRRIEKLEAEAVDQEKYRTQDTKRILLLRSRIEELEKENSQVYTQALGSELETKITELQAKLDSFKKLPSCEFHDRQYPYASLGKWVRVADIEYTWEK